MTAPFRTSFPVPQPGQIGIQQQPIDANRFQGALNPQYQNPALQGPSQGTTEFSPNRNLIGQQFGPTQSDQLGQFGQQQQQAGQNVGNFQTGQFQGVPTSQFGQFTDRSQNLLGQAGQAATQAGNVPQFGAIAPQQSGQAGQLLGQAGQELGNAQLGQFGQIGANQDPRVRQLEEQQQQAILNSGPGQFNNIAGGEFSPSTEAARARGLTSQALESLAGAPSRQDIALQTLQNLDAEQADIRQLGIQDIGRGAAKFGRLGSGVVTTQLGDLESQLNSQRERSLRDLSANTAAAERGDLLAALSGLSGAGGQFTAEDLASGGFQQGLRQEDRGERADRLSNTALGSGLGLQQANALGGLAGDIAGRETGLRQEERGERGFQAGLGSEAANLALQRLGAGQSLAGQQFGIDEALRGQELGERGFLSNQALQQSGLQSDQARLLSGLAGQEFGQGEALRAEDRGERDTQFNQQQSALQNLLAQQGAAQSLQGQQFEQEQRGRDEFRTERDYQQYLQQQATQNATQQRVLEEQIAQQGFGNRMDILGLLSQNAQSSQRFGNLDANLLNLLQQQATGTSGSSFDFLNAFGGSGPTGTTTNPPPNPEGIGVQPFTNPFGPPPQFNPNQLP